MKPWYRNSTLQMDDGEMEFLQSKDPATCAVWEWLKGDGQKRGDGKVRELSESDLASVSRRLGLDSPRFSQISQNLRDIGWIVKGRIRGWEKWQGSRSPEEDALRKQVEYWKEKANKKAENGESPKVSQSLPRPPRVSHSEERRGEKSRGDAMQAHFPEVNGHPTLSEVKAKAQMMGLADWKAVDFFHEMQGCGWIDHNHRPIKDWVSVLTRVKVKWESDGRPMSPPKPRVATTIKTPNPNIL